MNIPYALQVTFLLSTGSSKTTASLSGLGQTELNPFRASQLPRLLSTRLLAIQKLLKIQHRHSTPFNVLQKQGQPASQPGIDFITLKSLANLTTSSSKQAIACLVINLAQ